MNENEAFSMLHSLGNYLKSDVQIVGTGHTYVKRNGHMVTLDEEERIVTVTVKNTAPVEPRWPLVVFTGVGLAFNSTKWTDGGNMREDTVYKMREFTQYKAGNSYERDAHDVPVNRLEEKQWRKVDSSHFPVLTEDELRQQFILYPGDSVVFEFRTPPALRPGSLRIEGTISRRHLFHFARELGQ